MTFYAVIDTNVLISALLSSHDDAATVLVVRKLFTGELVPLYSEKILDEYYDVLHRDRFRFTEAIVDNMLASIKHLGVSVEPSPSGELLPDMKDLPFYEVVMDMQDNNAYLVTGNSKHFPQKRFVVTAKQMLEIIEKST